MGPANIVNFFSSSEFMPHGHCYLWQPALLWLNASTDSLIFLSYLAISGMLAFLVLKLKTIPFNLVYILFGIFIFACGLTHLMEIVNIWVPSYWLTGLIKFVTAIASLGTAIVLPSYLPKIQALIKTTELLHQTEVQLIEDIEKRKQVEENLTLALKEAEKANLAKSEFLANISHEIRTPMNIIMGMSQILEESPLNKEQEKYVSLFKKSGNSLLNIINDLLEISKIEAGNLNIENSEINLKLITEEIVELYTTKASEKKITLNFSVNKLIPANLMGDDLRIKQVLMNLVGNAIKFASSGEVSIAVEPNTITHRKGNILFKVTDTGIGISQAEALLLFQPFSQANSSITKTYGGTGLGLAICKKLVEKMGGEVWFESIEGKGSVFFFTIACETSAQKLSIAPTKIDGLGKISFAEGGAKRILLVDDAEDNRVLIKALLRNTDFQITEAENGEVALNKAKQEKFDIILMDLQMPILDGYSATQQIRNWEIENHLPRTPIVALTAFALAEERQKSIAAGCDKHLTKPIKKSELMQLFNL